MGSRSVWPIGKKMQRLPKTAIIGCEIAEPVGAMAPCRLAIT
jgi:hypothetical protein